MDFILLERGIADAAMLKPEFPCPLHDLRTYRDEVDGSMQVGQWRVHGAQYNRAVNSSTFEPSRYALHTAASMRALEQSFAHSHGLDTHALMQGAGNAVFERVRALWPEARCWRIYCGAGNNGGDGYVVADRALQAGRTVQLVRVGAPSEAAEASAARAVFLANGAREYTLADLAGLPSPDVCVDAVLGIGLNRSPDGEYADAIAAINAGSAPVLSVDVPSGLNADTGAAPGDCVRATVTLALIAWKRGLFTGRARACVGRLLLADMDLKSSSDADTSLIAAVEMSRLLAARARDAHKGNHGHVLIIGGDHGMAGAVLLAADAALRTGAGWVSVATRGAHISGFLARRPELMVHGCDDVEKIRPLLSRADVLVVGPGLGQSEWSRQLLAVALASGKSLVLDADALNLIAATGAAVPADAICTPHPGEAGRLLAVPTADVEADRFSAMQALLQRCGGAVVLKGAGTLIGSATLTQVCDRGNPGMASAGMGDVLSGVIAALRAQGLSSFDAARAGVWVHATAADRAASAGGERGMLASDVIERVRRLVNP